MARWIDTQIARKLKVNGGAVTYDGIAIRFPRNVGVGFASSIYWNGTNGFEPNTWRVLRFFLTRSSHFFDVGSNIGFYSVLARKVSPSLNVDSFEPVPAIAQKNRQFHYANGVVADGIHELALSDRDGEGEIFLPVTDSTVDEETTATVREESWQARKPHARVAIRLRKLDTFASEAPVTAPLLIKIDVEDYESAVLKGAVRLIRQVRPVIVSEVLPRSHGNVDTVQILRDLRYEVFAITDDGLFRFADEDFRRHRGFTDFLFLAEETVNDGIQYAGYEDIGAILREG